MSTGLSDSCGPLGEARGGRVSKGRDGGRWWVTCPPGSAQLAISDDLEQLFHLPGSSSVKRGASSLLPGIEDVRIGSNEDRASGRAELGTWKPCPCI